MSAALPTTYPPDTPDVADSDDDEDEDILHEHRRWLENVAVHGRSRADSAAYTCETDFPPGEDSEDDFKFNLFGPSRASRHLLQGHHRKVQDASVRRIQADDFLVDVPQDGTDQGPSSSLTQFEGLALEKLKLNRLYYTSLVKLNLRLSILSKVIEAITMAKAGVQYSVRSWMSYGISLGMNIISSCFILWRFSGKYSLPEEAVSTDLRLRLQQREKRCILCQAVCKFATATNMLTFALCEIVVPSALTDIESFLQSTYLTAGFATGGAITRMSLATWIAYLSRKGLGESDAVTSETILTWITSAFSLETAAVSYYLTTSNASAEKAWQAFKYGHIVEVILAALMLAFGVKDVMFACRPWCMAPPKTTSSEDLTEG